MVRLHGVMRWRTAGTSIQKNVFVSGITLSAQSTETSDKMARTKMDRIKNIQEILVDKKGMTPEMSYLMKLSDSEIVWLIMSICMSKSYTKEKETNQGDVK
jgi:hypothetical protein